MRLLNLGSMNRPFGGFSWTCSVSVNVRKINETTGGTYPILIGYVLRFLTLCLVILR